MPTVSQDDVRPVQEAGGRLGCPQVAHKVHVKKNISKTIIKKKQNYIHTLSTSKQYKFVFKEALRKKCTTYSCVKSSQESIGGAYNVWKQSLPVENRG